MRETLQELSNRVANHEHLTVQTQFPPTITLDESYRKTVESIVKIMKPKITNANTISVSFLSNTFDDMTNVQTTLDEKTEDGEIPDEIIMVLSTELYGKHFNDLNDNEQAIIKVLACYIMISK